MKPLSEWTTEEIVEELKFGHGVPELCGGTDALIDELLRRKERETIERCAKLCESRAVDLITQPAGGRSVATRELWTVAKDIRGLQ